MQNLSQVSPADLEPVQGTSMLLRVDGASIRATDWAAQHKVDIERLVSENGALLIRGLNFAGSQQFGTVLSTLFNEDLLQYTYRSTPRTELRGNVYTATEYHQDQWIPQHNENSYTNRWAMRIGFMCTVPPESGGTTPICSSRRIYQEMPLTIRDRFERLGVLYQRNYSEIDVPWTEVFQTEDRDEVAAFCDANDIQFEWIGERGLRTRQVNQGTARHPVTGEPVWFNQAHLFHVSNLEEAVRSTLLGGMTEAELPRNTYYGDGSPIEAETLATIRELYERHTVAFEWQRGDLMLLDNMLYSHGRSPYKGNRQILVGMARIHEAATTAVPA
ncbi:MAG: TauD/TfdA family dioxygenase [Rhodanobacter sp.]